MEAVYEDIGNYKPKRNIKVLIVSDGMIADIMSNKKTSGYNQRIVY